METHWHAEAAPPYNVAAHKTDSTTVTDYWVLRLNTNTSALDLITQCIRLEVKLYR